QTFDAGLRRVDALADRVEVLPSGAVADDDLAVEHVVARGEDELREVAPERPAVARLQEHLLPVHEGEAAEAVQLDLIGVVLARRQLLAGESELWRERRLQRKAHACPLPAPRARLGCTRGGSPLCLREGGGEGASPRPSRSSRAASSSRGSRLWRRSSMSAEGSPRSRRRVGTVSNRSSPGSTSGTSSHSRGHETSASGTALTEYAE